MIIFSYRCKGGMCLTYSIYSLFLDLIRINTGTYLYNILQRSEFPVALSITGAVCTSPIKPLHVGSAPQQHLEQEGQLSCSAAGALAAGRMAVGRTV